MSLRLVQCSLRTYLELTENLRFYNESDDDILYSAANMALICWGRYYHAYHGSYKSTLTTVMGHQAARLLRRLPETEGSSYYRGIPGYPKTTALLFKAMASGIVESNFWHIPECPRRDQVLVTCLFATRTLTVDERVAVSEAVRDSLRQLNENQIDGLIRIVREHKAQSEHPVFKLFMQAITSKGTPEQLRKLLG